MLQVTGLVKQYKKYRAVDSLSFSIAPGEIIGLLGPNGAGKTTAMRCVAGILRPSEGQVLINGVDLLKDQAKAKRGMAFVPEVPSLYELLTVDEHLKFVAMCYDTVPTYEQMGDELFNENLVQNLLDVRNRWLRPHGRILPSRFRLFIEPVTMTEAMRVRRFWNIDLPDGIDLSPMQESLLAQRYETGKNEQTWLRPGAVAATMGSTTPIMEFDLNTLDRAESLPTEFVIERTANADMIVDGTCIWFEAVFDDETVLSTSPLAPITSWGNRMYRLDREFAKGEQLRIGVHMGRLVDPDSWMVTHH